MCTSTIRQLAYDTVPDAHDEYLKMFEATSRLSLEHYVGLLWKFLDYTTTDVEKLYAFHKQKHEFSGMLGCLNCTYCEWFGCPIAYKAQYCRHDHGPNPFILLVAVVSQDL
ncbi:RNA-directed DNA polymerase, eukaryota [Tanacetum coccineum]|uniref:RNA-directed DNA polymerase, eukaryota n=1 Tax=Tanacetum coccineum TaxID=301880 RepID=A0ABQ5FVL7_9ASTR